LGAKTKSSVNDRLNDARDIDSHTDSADLP
jgi:hypothetical protein